MFYLATKQASQLYHIGHICRKGRSAVPYWAQLPYRLVSCVIQATAAIPTTAAVQATYAAQAGQLCHTVLSCRTGHSFCTGHS